MSHTALNGGKDNKGVKVSRSRWHNAFGQHRRLLFFGAVIAFLIIGSVAWLYLADISLIRVSAAGIPINGTPKDHQLLSEAANHYQWTVRWPDNTLKNFRLADAGLEVDASQTITKATALRLPINPFIRFNWRKHYFLPISLRINETKFNQFIHQSLTVTTKPPHNAEIKVANGNVEISPDQTGEGYTLSADLLKSSAAHLQSSVLNMNMQPLTAPLSKDILKPVQAKLETVLSQKIAFTLGDNVLSPKRTDIGSWLELTPVPQEQTVDVTVNSGKIAEFMSGASRTYMQVPQSQVITPPSMGSQVLIPGKNGVELINREEAAASVATKLLDAKGLDIALPVKFRNFSTVVAQPQGKWIIIDTTTKRLYAYEQTNPVKTMPVTAGAPQTPTVLGTFKIYRKVRKQDMRGFNADGSRYFQPNVEWVNYFYADYAIHGNYWRPASYFGNINSSHGCVGITNSEAAWLYGWATEGTTVIVHN